jgi:hypothetical protein
VKAAGRAFVSPISAFPSGMRRGEGPARPPVRGRQVTVFAGQPGPTMAMSAH